MEKNFRGVFPFTTEAISKYYSLFDFQNKDVLTVGSSGDQAFNALSLGANKVTIFDISPYTKDFVNLKRDYLLRYDRKDFYDKVIHNDKFPVEQDYFSFSDLEKMNFYMKDDNSYYQLRKKLENDNISFVVGDIFKMKDYSLEKYDLIIFSNVLQYLNYYMKHNNIKDKEFFVRTHFQDWISYLEENGVLQIIYLYSVSGQKEELISLLNPLWDQYIQISQFTNVNDKGDPAILYYRK